MNDSLLDTIKPNSDQLNADDLIGGPIVVTITGYKRRSDPKHPIEFAITGDHQPYRPCLSMRRVMIAIWGDKPGDLIGKSLELYRDPTVIYGGKPQGGIRISRMSGIDKPVTVMLTVRRGHREPYSVRPLIDAFAPSDGPTYDDLMGALANAPSAEFFESIKADAKRVYRSLDKQQQQQLTAAIKAVEAELSE